MIDFETFQKIKQQSEEDYSKIGKVYCPYLKKNVSFNRKGLEHIKTKNWNKTRVVADQFARLKFLKIAPKVIEFSHTLQELEENVSFERQKINSKWVHRKVLTKCYGFVAIMYGVRIKVIIKEIAGAEPYFLSIIPFWKQKEHPLTGQIERVFSEGVLEKQ